MEPTTPLISNPDGCNRCFPCPTPADCGCWCHEPDDAPPDKFTWKEGDVQYSRGIFRTAVHRPNYVKLVETVAELAEAAGESGQTPDELLDQLIERGELDHAPKSLTDELEARGVIRPADEPS